MLRAVAADTRILVLDAILPQQFNDSKGSRDQQIVLHSQYEHESTYLYSPSHHEMTHILVTLVLYAKHCGPNRMQATVFRDGINYDNSSHVPVRLRASNNFPLSYQRWSTLVLAADL